MPRTFRVNARNFALTYPHQDGIDNLTVDALIDCFTALGSNYGLVSKELHADGTPHFHALVQFPKKKDVTDPLYFDVGGCHPNVQGCRDKDAWRQYIMKDNDFKSYGNERSRSTGWVVPDYDHNDTWVDWMNKCTSAQLPHAYCKAYWDSYTSMDAMFTIPEGYSTPPDATISDPVLNELNYSALWDDGKTLVIIGPSGCGKTTWAKANVPKPALWVSHIEDLKQLRKCHKAIIFDDISFTHWPRESQIHLVDRYDLRSIHIRYGRVTIPPGIAKVVTANNDPVDLGDNAIERRCNVLRLPRSPSWLQ